MLHRKLCKSRIQSQSNRDQQWDSYHSKVTSAGFGRLGQIVGCILAALLPAYQLQAQVIEPPQLNISVYGELVSITWSEVADAEAYRLYYAPFPDAEVIESLVLGLTPSLSGILPVQSAFYVAIATLVGGGESAISNIETFFIETTEFDPEIDAITEGDWYRPGLEDSWQWQLLGEVNTSYDVELYDIDLFDVPITTIQELKSQDKKVICYFSAGSYEDFRDDAGQFSAAILGEPLDGFPDERWLDIASNNAREMVLSRLDVAKNKGYDGVEPDNVDRYVNASGFDLDADAQLAFNRFIANEAHARGLSVGLKNDLDQVPELVDYFDFMVNEQCHEFDECETLQPFIDAAKPVFNAEYADSFVDDDNQRNSMCEDANSRGFATLVLPLDLDDSFRISCR